MSKIDKFKRSIQETLSKWIKQKKNVIIICASCQKELGKVNQFKGEIKKSHTFCCDKCQTEPYWDILDDIL